MVKPTKPKTKICSANLGTRVKRQSAVVKNVCKGHRKRILMLRRRVSAFLDEKESWEAKNRELINNYNTEKRLNAELQKDVFNWQRLYHEAIISQNTYKVKYAESIQNITSCLKETKSAFPHLVGLSDALCRTQIKLTHLINASQAFEAEHHFPQAFGDCRLSTNDLSKKSEKRMKHKVGPMVNGVLIQKPTIRLERVMLHQPQGREQTNDDDLAPQRGNALTPIVEENDQENDLQLEQVSLRRKRKHRLGTGERWRMRKQQEQLVKERERERERERESQRLVSESSDSEDQLGPVIRLQRVSGLLLSPDLLEVERGRSSEGKVNTSRLSESENLRLRGEDPKEGCSWMHLPVRSQSMSKKRKESSSASSDSSDDSDSPPTVAEKTVRDSVSMYKNKTFTMKRKSSGGSSSGDTSREASDSSNASNAPPEPDSTNNIEVCSRQSADSLGMCSDSNANSTELVACSGPGDGTDSLMARPSVSRTSTSYVSSTPIASPAVSKRVRKPKVHTYPGEEPELAAPTSKVKKAKLVTTSNRKKSANRLSAGKSIERRSQKNSLEAPPTKVTSSQRSSQGTSNGSSVSKKTVGRQKKSSVKTSAPAESSRSSMMSTSTSTLRFSQDQVSDVSDSGRNSRRNRGPVSYKEPPCNVKLRRPK